MANLKTAFRVNNITPQSANCEHRCEGWSCGSRHHVRCSCSGVECGCLNISVNQSPLALAWWAGLTATISALTSLLLLFAPSNTTASSWYFNGLVERRASDTDIFARTGRRVVVAIFNWCRLSLRQSELWRNFCRRAYIACPRSCLMS